MEVVQQQDQARTEITEGDRIEGRGQPITLIDGRVVRLRFGAKALRYLEKTYGSLAAFQEEAMKGAAGKAASATFDALIAGLMHERLGTPDEVEDLLDEERLTTEYADAFSRSWGEALPPEGKAQGTIVRPSTKAESEAVSPGQTSTTSSPQNLTEQTSSSGL
jgi:hypothetical protein